MRPGGCAGALSRLDLPSGRRQVHRRYMRGPSAPGTTGLRTQARRGCRGDQPLSSSGGEAWVRLEAIPGKGGSGPARCCRSGLMLMTAIQSCPVQGSRSRATALWSLAAIRCTPASARSSYRVPGAWRRKIAACLRSSPAWIRTRLRSARATGLQPGNRPGGTGAGRAGLPVSAALMRVRAGGRGPGGRSAVPSPALRPSRRASSPAAR